VYKVLPVLGNTLQGFSESGYIVYCSASDDQYLQQIHTRGHSWTDSEQEALVMDFKTAATVYVVLTELQYYCNLYIAEGVQDNA
jgi:hypothetical protein